MNKIEVGKTCDTDRGSFRCIHIEGDIAWMVSGNMSTAYTWTVDGATLAFSENGNVNWSGSHPKTITRTITYPAPETEAPARGAEYFIPDLSSEAVQAWDWEGDEVDHVHLRLGLVYLTEEDAIARAKAMLE